jgi:hypothetical protein
MADMQDIEEQIGGVANSTADNQSRTGYAGSQSGISSLRKKIIYSSSCDDSFLIFFYACASRSYDAFSFFHKA